MIDFFNGLPIWLMSTLVLGVSLLVGLGSSLGLRRLLRLSPSDDEVETAVSLMQVVAAYIGILIAFAGVQVWQDFSDTENAVHEEAASAAQLYRDLGTYGPETGEARADLRAYVSSIVRDEWPLLAQGQSSLATENALFELFDSVGRLEPVSQRDGAIYNEIFSKLNDLVELRRDRLMHSTSGMPAILWVVGLLGSVLIVAYASTFPPTRTHKMMIAGISVALGLVFLFILIVDRPFMGQYQVGNDELAGLAEKFDGIDRLSPEAAKPAPGVRPKP